MSLALQWKEKEFRKQELIRRCMEAKSLPTVIFNLELLHWNRVMKQDKFDKEGQIK